MPRRLRNAPLWLRLLVRRLRSPEGKLAPLAVLSIAVSVTLATGLEMASRSAQRQLDITAEAIVGSAEIEITAGSVGLAEEILEVVRATPGVRAASPLVSVMLRLVDHDFPLNLIGVDLIAEEQVRSTAIERGGLEIRDPLRLLAVPNSVVVTENLLGRLGLSERHREGGTAEFRVRLNGTETTLVVQGVLRPTGIAAAYGGQVALMDVYAAQQLAGRNGLFDRIDVVPVEDQDVPELIATLASRFAGVATVERSSARSGAAEDLLQMVRRASLMLAAVGVLVACLLTYATTAQWVERQKRQLATLRAVGMEGRRVRQMILVEISALALLGTALGIASGIAISPAVLATLSKFLEVSRAEEITGVELQLSTLWVAIGVGLVAGFSGGLLPAYRAGRRFTLDSIDFEAVTRARRDRGLWLGVSCLAAFAFVASVAHWLVRDAAMIRVGILFLLGPLATLSLAPTLLRVLGIALAPVARAWPSLGHLVTRFFRARPWTFAVALTAISTLVGALVTVFLLIATINSAADRFIESRYPAGATLVSPEPLTGRFIGETISAETLDLIRTTPGVSAVDERYRTIASVVYRGRVVYLNAQSMDVVARHGHLSGVGRATPELAQDLQRGAIAISTGFAKTHGMGPGDVLELDTRSGSKSFSIAGIFEDFGDANGSIILDIGTFDAHWSRVGASAAMFWVNGPPEAAIAEIRRRVVDKQDLFFIDVNEAAAMAHRQTGVFTSTLRVLGAFISSLGGIGVMILLIGIVAERRRDLAVLRAAGAEPRQLVFVVVLDAVVLGLLGSACGLALGLASAAPAADILRESFGWILEQRWMAPELPSVILGALASAILGALLPARMAYRTTPDAVFGPE